VIGEWWRERKGVRGLERRKMYNPGIDDVDLKSELEKADQSEISLISKADRNPPHHPTLFLTSMVQLLLPRGSAPVTMSIYQPP
jgi:hypothetical protein